MQVRTRKKISEILPGQKNNQEDVMHEEDKLLPVGGSPCLKSEPSASPDRPGPYVDGSPVSYVDCKVGLVL